MRVVFIPCTSYQEYPRVCRDVGACPRAWGARLLRRKLEKLESVLYHDKRVFLLFSILCTSSFLSAPSHPFFLLLFVFLTPCRSPPPFPLPRARRIGRCRTAPRRPLAKLNHFHREYIRHVQNLPDDRERSYVISAHQHIIAYLFFTLTYIALQEYSCPITPIFFSLPIHDQAYQLPF